MDEEGQAHAVAGVRPPVRSTRFEPFPGVRDRTKGVTSGSGHVEGPHRRTEPGRLPDVARHALAAGIGGSRPESRAKWLSFVRPGPISTVEHPTCFLLHINHVDRNRVLFLHLTSALRPLQSMAS